MDSSRKSNKIRDIVRLQQMIKKWKKLAHNNTTTATTTTTTTTASLARSASSSGSGSKSIKFLKKTLSFSETSSGTIQTNATTIPKGYMAVCVGKELKRFVIPTEYLSHQAFGILLREAEEEFGFQQEGVLKFPCDVDLFEKVLKMMMQENNNNKRLSTSSASSAAELLTTLHDDIRSNKFIITCGGNGYSPDHSGMGSPSLHHPQMCR